MFAPEARPLVKVRWEYSGLCRYQNNADRIFQSKGFDAIMVVVDRLSKRRHFSPCLTTLDDEGLAALFVPEGYLEITWATTNNHLGSRSAFRRGFLEIIVQAFGNSGSSVYSLSPGNRRADGASQLLHGTISADVLRLLTGRLGRLVTAG